MDTAIIVALIGLVSGGVTAIVTIAINRLNRKDAKEDKASTDILEIVNRIDLKVDGLEKAFNNEQRMSVLSVGDKLRHYATKYIARRDTNDIQAVKDWLSLEESYELNKGNGHIAKLKPEMEQLLIDLEIEKETDNIDA